MATRKLFRVINIYDIFIIAVYQYSKEKQITGMTMRGYV